MLENVKRSEFGVHHRVALYKSDLLLSLDYVQYHMSKDVTWNRIHCVAAWAVNVGLVGYCAG